MHKKTSRIVSILSILLVSGTLYSPAVNAAELKPNVPRGSSVKEQSKELETLRQSLKKDNFNVKVNNENVIEIYSNEVAKINASPKAASGLNYGSWFGGADSYYSASPSEVTKVSLVLFAILNPWLTSSSAALTAAKSITAGLGMTMKVTPGQTLAADRTKRYRQVTYSDGSFAYWQTKIGASVSLDDDYYGYDEAIISGGQW